MKKLIFSLVLVLIATPAFALDLTIPGGEDPQAFLVQQELQKVDNKTYWGLTKKEWAAEGLFQVLNAADFLLSEHIIHSHNGYEQSVTVPISRHSSDLEIAAVGIVYGGLHLLATKYLFNDKLISSGWRSTWQVYSSGLKGVIVVRELGKVN